MSAIIQHSVKLCIQAINNSGDGLDAEVLDAIRSIAELPYKGTGLGIGRGGYRGYKPSYEDLLKRFIERKTINSSLDWESALLLLYDAGGFSESEILSSAKSIEDDIIFNHILEHVISNLAAKNDIEMACSFIPNFRTTTIFKEENNLDSGYLILLCHYASLGDATHFFNYFKLAEPAKNKSEIAELKSYLVESFAAKNGIADALKLCAHKNLGAKYHSNALLAFAKTGKYAELKSIFDQYPELKHNETELGLLSTAYYQAKKNKFVVDDDFESLFERALQLDRKIKYGDIKMQDAVLFDLCLAEFDNKERREKCRKAIKNNSIKKELNDY
ncbi:hypothetical protein [Flavobacterium cerinum]|uniref:Uncharacterized protein n=1 Tax=Flavobacterium cerinum TaxID=2502784 RepID=A0A3S3RD12_9FLAO|nr:hypothetical protein [Flavobacterium cerinum]RWW91784.1 hypothetical protein EPI11_18040 [Flavobacterium cerinum]